MRVVIQRVSEASVQAGDLPVRSIGRGLLILAGIEENDGPEDAHWLAGKIARLRIFPDAGGVMNLSVGEAGGEVLIVSQFTLHALTRKGNRPSYIRAARPETAIPLYRHFIERVEAETGKTPQTGEFGAMMKVALVNDGPVTILMDTKNKE